MTDTSTGSAVAHALLALEIAQRDTALLQYRTTRESYELARLQKQRRQWLTASHAYTLSLLQETLTSAKNTLEEPQTLCDTSSTPAVSNATVSAVQLALRTSHYDTLERQLRDILTNDAHRRQIAAPPSISIPSLSFALSKLQVDPLLLWCAARLEYRGQIHPARRTLASELARAKSQVAWWEESAGARASDDHSRGEEHSAPVAALSLRLEEARDAFKAAKDFQQRVKGSLYQCHQRIASSGVCRGPKSSAGGSLDCDTTAEMHARIVKELQGGNVTLLRLLCEEISRSPPGRAADVSLL